MAPIHKTGSHPAQGAQGTRLRPPRRYGFRRRWASHLEHLRKTLVAKADDLRQRAKPIWEALEALEGHERDRRAFESSLVNLERCRLCITVMGEFNTGKSTLLNTFIGEGLLETDLLECTAVPTWVRWIDDEGYDENRRATVIRTNGESESMPLSQISAHTTLDQNSWEAIERVEITVPHTGDADQPSTGLVLVDTPGLNGRSELEARSIHQLGMSHVTIVVVPVDGIETATNTALIERALAIADRVMVVINKCDQHMTEAGYEPLREALHDRAPSLGRENIYTLSAKRQFEGAIYQDHEQRLRSEFQRFANDLTDRVLPDPVHALEQRPVALLREICKAQIGILTRVDAESDTDATKDLDTATSRLEDLEKDLERSRESIERLARRNMMGEVAILEGFLTNVRSRVEGELRAFVDDLADPVVAQDDLDAARRSVSVWLDGKLRKTVLERMDRLLRASAQRLLFDLEARVAERAPRLDLPGIAPLRLDTAALERHTSRANDALRQITDEVAALERAVEASRRTRRKQQAKAEKLQERLACLERLEARRRDAVAERERLGPKPNPTRTWVTQWETREVKRGGLLGWIPDLFHKQTKRCPVLRERQDYRPVERWERASDAARKRVADLDKQIAPLVDVRQGISAIERKLKKSQREADRAASNLRDARRRLKDEQARYRTSGLANRRALLKAGAVRELERVFESLPHVLEREAQELLSSVSRQFPERFRDAADRHRAALAAEIERRTESARAADAGRAKRHIARETLRNALETFLEEPRTTGGTTV